MSYKWPAIVITVLLCFFGYPQVGLAVLITSALLAPSVEEA